MTDAIGWVYVMSNLSMPGLVKVGFSMKDPTLRAEELNTTGVPTRFDVEYKVLVHGPASLERMAHEQLQHVKHGKEFFRCSVSEAVRAIQLKATKLTLLEISGQGSSSGVLSPSVLFKNLIKSENFASSKWIDNFESLFRGLELVYRYIEAIDFYLSERYLKIINDKISHIYLLDAANSNANKEALKFLSEKIQSASLLLSEDCKIRFNSNTSAYRLFVELRLIGYWDLADRVCTGMANIGVKDPADETITEIRKDWSKRSPVSIYCVLNQFMLNGGNFILSHPRIVMPQPAFDLFDGIDDFHPSGWFRSNGRFRSPLIGIPRWSAQEILMTSDVVLLPKGYITTDEVRNYSHGSEFACWADFSAWGEKRIAYSDLTHALRHMYDHVSRDSWPNLEGIDGYLFDESGEKVGCIYQLQQILVSYTSIDSNFSQCYLSSDGVYTLRYNSGQDIKWRIDYWSKNN